MPKKLQSDDDDLMKIFEHYAELRREHAEYETVHTLECDIASLQGRVDQLEELNKQLTEERDQFLERHGRPKIFSRLTIKQVSSKPRCRQIPTRLISSVTRSAVQLP